MSKFFLLTFGCPKNEVVSENIALKLLEFNIQQTLEISEADFIITNTCGFITSALEENLQTIKSLIRNKGKNQKIAVFGCIPQRFSLKTLILKYPDLKEIDLWAKTFTDLQDFIKKSQSKIEGSKLVTRLNTFSPFAYVEIAEGCSNSCAYCTIPSFKGPYKSKPIEQIIKEIASLIEYGVQEIILIAQETTFYGLDLKPKTSLSNLINKICQQFPQLPRVRIMYAHPNGITDELIETIRNNPQVCPYIDLPLQHIDTKILKSMNRFYSEEKVKQLIMRLRNAIPSIVIRSTFIVGYPGESETQFEKLEKFLKEYQIDHAGFFAFEKESGTKAATLKLQIPQRIKLKRLKEIYALQENISKQKNDGLVGKTFTVLTDFNDDYFTYGRAYFQTPEIDGYIKIKGQLEIGKYIKVIITRNEYPNLLGKRV